VKQLKGVAASRGICIGPVFKFIRAELKFDTSKIDDPQAEMERLNDALQEAKRQIQQIYEKAVKDHSKENAEIFQAHKLILDDPELISAIKKKIEEEHKNAESAISETAQAFSALMAAMQDEYFAARATDIKDVGDRVLRILLGATEENPTAGLKLPSVIVADDLTPSDTIMLDKSLVLGFCTARGSATSHTAILARGLGLPALAGAGAELMNVKDGTTLIVDGTHGVSIIDPDVKTAEDYQKLMQASQTMQAQALKHAHETAITTDGHQIEVVANIGNVKDSKAALDNGAEGVGLLRTEFIYLERTSMPDEEEQYQVYHAIMDAFGDKPVILRTLDVGGDKEIPYLNLEQEMNPFLGERALRLCLSRPDIFKPQLRAALRAGVGHNLKIMYPMVATVAEVQAARKVFEECLVELRAEGKPFAENIEVGIMVEIPSAAIIADQLAKQVDFFSIGTNDLSQYTMAADRTNPKVAGLSNAFQPAVLRLVRDVIKAAHAEGKWVGMCGELAGEPLATPILIGLGLDEFSMSPPFVPIIKQIIRNLNAEKMAVLAEKALKLESPDAICDFVRSEVPVITELSG
jgi:phosphotransferase system enzyme I (PtsI)